MAASRKTYRVVAERLEFVLRNAASDEKDGIAKAVRAVADGLKFDNPAFRFDKFFEAVGLDMHGYVIGTVHMKGA